MNRRPTASGRGSPADEAVPPICLCMIVRNESPVIAACLDSVRDLISHWIVVDTGSEDETVDIVRDRLSGLPGRVLHSRWTDDFSFHRNESIAAARELMPNPDARLLFIDADEAVVVRRPGALRQKIRDRVALEWWAVSGDWHFRKLGIVRSGNVDRWVGVRHEQLQFRSDAEPKAHDVCTDAFVRYGDGGFRRGNVDFRDRDMEQLTAAAHDDASAGGADLTSYRTQFFIARTHESSGNWNAAAESFRLAASAPDIALDDRWQALWGVARSLQPVDEAAAADAYREAFALDPRRAEPLVALAAAARRNGMLEQGVLLAQAALACRAPRRTSMYDHSAYTWRAADELALCASEVGNEEAMRQSLTILEASQTAIAALPEDEQHRLNANIALLRSNLY